MTDTPRMDKARGCSDDIADAQFLAMSDEGDRLERELAAATATVERVRAERDAIARQGERDRIASISYQNQLAAMIAERDEWRRRYVALSTTSGQLEGLLITTRNAKDKALAALKRLDSMCRDYAGFMVISDGRVHDEVERVITELE